MNLIVYFIIQRREVNVNSTITVSITPDELSALITMAINKAMTGITSPPPRVAESEIMDIDQAAELLHLTKSTVYSYTHLRKLPYIKRSGKLLFKRSVLMAWMNEGNHLTADEIQQFTYNSANR